MSTTIPTHKTKAFMYHKRALASVLGMQRHLRDLHHWIMDQDDLNDEDVAVTVLSNHLAYREQNHRNFIDNSPTHKKYKVVRPVMTWRR